MTAQLRTTIVRRAVAALAAAAAAATAAGLLLACQDAAFVFTERLPLDRLVAAGRSPLLPDRLRVRVAIAAFARAVLLDREAAAAGIAPSLRSLAPHLAPDLDRYTTATAAADRHRAAILLPLRTPGMHTSVRGIDDEWSYEAGEPSTAFEHIFQRNWWCGVDGRGGEPFTPPRSDSDLMTLIYGGTPAPFPEFLSAAERDTVARERLQLAAIGPAPNYLSKEAVDWARAAPKDERAAAALAHAVEGARWTCEGVRDPQRSRRAFQTLHQVFPDSRWAAQTKYWYE